MFPRKKKYQLLKLVGRNKVWPEGGDVGMTLRVCVAGGGFVCLREENDVGFGWVAKGYYVEIGVGGGLTWLVGKGVW